MFSFSRYSNWLTLLLWATVAIAVVALAPLVASSFHFNLARLRLNRVLLAPPRSASGSTLLGSVSDFSQTVRFRPLAVQSYLALGQAYTAAGDQENAIRAFEAGLNLSPSNPAILYMLAIAYEKQGRYTAIAELGTHLSGLQTAFLAHGDSYVRAGKFKEAASAYQSAIIVAPDSILAHYSLGFAYETFDVESAIAAYQAAIDLDRKQNGSAGICSDCYARLGLIYLNTGVWDLAEQNLQHSLILQPSNWHAHFWLAVWYSQRGRAYSALAAQEIQQAIVLSEWVRDTQPLLIGRIFESAGEMGKAACWYARLPDNPEAQDGLRRVGEKCTNASP